MRNKHAKRVAYQNARNLVSFKIGWQDCFYARFFSPVLFRYCPQCKAHREATKQMSLWRLPTILIVQLKRFSFKNLIWRDKIDKMVEYPIRYDICTNKTSLYFKKKDCMCQKTLKQGLQLIKKQLASLEIYECVFM